MVAVFSLNIGYIINFKQVFFENEFKIHRGLHILKKNCFANIISISYLYSAKCLNRNKAVCNVSFSFFIPNALHALGL